MTQTLKKRKKYKQIACCLGEAKRAALWPCVCHPLTHPSCHVLFWMKREFNSCDYVVHSTRLDYPLSPLHSIISFFLCTCVCVCDLGGCAMLSHPGSLLQCFIQTNESLLFTCDSTALKLRPFKFLTKSKMKAKHHSDLCSLLMQTAFASLGKLITHILICLQPGEGYDPLK